MGGNVGGGDQSGPKSEKIYQALLNYVTPNDKVLLIPFAAETGTYERWFDDVSKPLKRIGINDIHLLSYNDSTQNMVEEIRSAQVLFLTGGKPDVLIRRLQEKRLTDEIKQFKGVLIGYSAGALALCKLCIITKDHDYPETAAVEALGITDFSVEVHYKAAIDEDLLPYSNDRSIYAIPDGAAIIWDGTSVMPIHKVIRMDRMSKLELEQ